MGQGPEVRKSSMWSKNQRQGPWLEGRVVQGETKRKPRLEGVPHPGHLSGSFSCRWVLVGKAEQGPVRGGWQGAQRGGLRPSSWPPPSHLHLADLPLQLRAHRLQLLLPLLGHLAFGGQAEGFRCPARRLPENSGEPLRTVSSLSPWA